MAGRSADPDRGPRHSPEPKRRQSPSPRRRHSLSPRRRLSTGRIHENFEKHSSPKRHHSTDATFALPVRLPHSQQPVEAAPHSNQSKPPMSIKTNQTEPTSDELLEMLPNICSCLLGLCGCGCGLDLCSLVPKLCSFLAGLCGSLSNSGVSAGQNYTSIADKVFLSLVIGFMTALIQILLYHLIAINYLA